MVVNKLVFVFTTQRACLGQPLKYSKTVINDILQLNAHLTKNTHTIKSNARCILSKPMQIPFFTQKHMHIQTNTFSP